MADIPVLTLRGLCFDLFSLVCGVCLLCLSLLYPFSIPPGIICLQISGLRIGRVTRNRFHIFADWFNIVTHAVANCLNTGVCKPESAFFHWDISVIYSIIALKLAVAVLFTSPYFRTFWPNWLKFFGHLKKKSVYDRKKFGVWSKKIRCLIEKKSHQRQVMKAETGRLILRELAANLLAFAPQLL